MSEAGRALGNAAGAYAGVYGQAINAAAKVGTSAIESALGGSSSSGSGSYDLSSFMDGSGWSVSTGGSRTDSKGAGGGGRTQSEPGSAPIGGAFGSISAMSMVAIVAAGVLVVAIVLKRRR